MGEENSRPKKVLKSPSIPTQEEEDFNGDFGPEQILKVRCYRKMREREAWWEDHVNTQNPPRPLYSYNKIRYKAHLKPVNCSKD